MLSVAYCDHISKVSIYLLLLLNIHRYYSVNGIKNAGLKMITLTGFHCTRISSSKQMETNVSTSKTQCYAENACVNGISGLACQCNNCHLFFSSQVTPILALCRLHGSSTQQNIYK